ncbi:hypothetical protein Mgra_00002892 [Meloidogyne graminicola]|uniref:Uncharacterized protein n=1 Tax=Meloidogyne graminicola TaxID=189291 RepID=A0A8S9ZX51_9BILA|nr:hypothetical protein Mgra_00002892 [Meloidogyne graminicola]
MSGPVEKLVTSNIIRKFPAVGDISYLQYNDLANLIYENLKHIGNKRIEKQIIVYASENAIKQVEGISECPEYWCDQVFNQRGVNIVIARFNKNDVYHGYSLMLRVNQQLLPEILKILKVKYYIELKKLLEEFKSNNISLVDNQIIRTATIVRHKTSWSEKCSFLLSTTKAYRRSTNELPFIDSFNFRNEPHKGLFDDFTCFVFYFAI